MVKSIIFGSYLRVELALSKSKSETGECFSTSSDSSRDA